jgi:hypothetical protein
MDGRLDEAVWESAPAGTHFTQKQPQEGQPATEDTEVKILYDDKNLYIGIMCFDSEPDKIIATEKRRDSNNIYDNDNLQILLDTFRDRRNGYVFVTNPVGARLDLQLRKEGKAEGGWLFPNPNLNVNWDGVWEVHPLIHQKGWSVEIEIPLVTLRFKTESKEGWGLNVLRNIRRKNEESTWAPLPRNQKLYKVSLAGDLNGLENLKKSLNLQVKPFLQTHRVSERADDSASLESEVNVKPGADFKYGVTSNLTLDVTVNTDFSQVEADDQQINLTRFSLFYPEKREFFLENGALFNVGTPDDSMIFFSRRIGISPEGEEIPLLGGVKLAGKINRFNVGFMNMQTKSTDFNPSNNFTVLRVGRDILGSSAIGMLFTNRQSSIDGDYNRAFALDGDFVLSEKLNFSGYYAKSSTPGLEGQDTAGKFMFKWLSNLWDFYGYYFDVEENFNAEMGFVKRTGIRRSQAHLGFTPEPDIPHIRRLDPHVFFAYTTDQQNNLLLRESHVHFAVNFINGGGTGLEWNEDYEFVDYPFQIQEDIVIPVGHYSNKYWIANYTTDRSRRIYGRARYRWGHFYGGYSHIYSFSSGFRPTNSFLGEVSFSYNDIDLPQGDFANHLLIGRFTYNFTTQLALMSLLQWNSDVDEVDVNLRLRYIYRPGSDLYVVYNERRLVEGPFAGTRDRSFAVKFTYLLNF